MAIISYNPVEIISEDPENEYVKTEAFLNHATVKQVDFLLLSLPPTIPKFLVVGPPDEIEKQEKKMQAEFSEYINVYRSEPIFIELVPLGIDKATALERLCKHLGVTKMEMMACGDGFNDTTMISFVGLGVAMGNAQDVIKKLAGFITLSNDEDGVAYAVEKFILHERE